jgi:hypothetical protein
VTRPPSLCQWCAIHPPWHDRCTGETGRWAYQGGAWAFVVNPCECPCQEAKLW